MKLFSVYYAIERKTGKYVCMGIGGAEDKHKLKEQMFEDMAKNDICAKYSSGAVYNHYGLVAVRSFQMPKEAPKKTRKKISEE